MDDFVGIDATQKLPRRTIAMRAWHGYICFFKSSI
jgi:hypothetical protein